MLTFSSASSRAYFSSDIVCTLDARSFGIKDIEDAFALRPHIKKSLVGHEYLRTFCEQSFFRGARLDMRALESKT